MNQDYDQEMEIREKMISRVQNGEKLTSEERLWLATHKIINRSLGHPFLNTDIIHLKSNTEYSLCIQVERCTYADRIIPVITVPAGKGWIAANSLFDINRCEVPSNKRVKMLGVLIDRENDNTEISYQSELGLIEVSYECDYYDEHHRMMIRKCSNIGTSDFAMICERIDENKMIYYCKTPVNEDFSSFVFSIKWSEKKT